MILLSEDVFNPGKYFHRAEGFYDIFISADFFSPFLFGYLALGCQHDDISVFKRWIGLDRAAHVVSIDFGHHDVEEQDVRPELFYFSERFSAVFCHRQCISFIFKEIGQRFSDVFVVVGYEDFFFVHIRGKSY
jgi:hypothetical protein